MPADPGKSFWDARAAESALYFVDNRLAYDNPDDKTFWGGAEVIVDALLGELGVEVLPTDTVVDIGCGVGRLTRVLAARAERVVGIDVSPRMLELARARNAALENVEWVEGDGLTLQPIADTSVDACVSHVVFQHLPDPEITYGYIREIGRVLRPGGWAAFQVSTDPEVHAWRPPLRDRLRAAARRAPRGLAHPNWRGSHVDLDRLREAADAGGLAVERVVHEGTQFCLVRTRRRT